MAEGRHDGGHPGGDDMTQICIKVIGANAAKARVSGPLTTGMVGAVARFSFDGVWKDLVKVAVFRGSGVTRDVLEWDGDAVRIPAEVLAAEGRLFVGVEGRNGDGSVVIPTVWVECGVVVCGANASGDVSTDPDLPVWAQIQSQIGPLEELQTKDKASLVAAINEVLRSGGGSVDEDAVERIVEAYLAEHPPEGGIHVGPEPPTDGSGLWADTDEDLSVGEDAVPAPPKAEVGQYLRVTEVGADGKIVATDTVGTDTSFSVSGAPADALVTGNNIKNIGKTLNAIEKASRYMTTSEWALSIDSVGMTVTVPAGMLACANWCIPVAEQTVAIVQDDPTTLVVYDSSADAVRSVRFTDYTGKTMYVIAVITRDRYAEPNANYVQGSYMVDGVLVGGRETGDYIPTPSTAQVGQTIVVKEVDGDGKPVSWECVDVAGGSSDRWTKLGDVTVQDTYEIVPLSFTAGIVTVDTTTEVYGWMSSQGAVRCVVHPNDLTSKTKPVLGILKVLDADAGTFEFFDRDNVKQATAAYDPAVYKISLANVASVSMEDIDIYSRYKMRMTTPVLTTHGVRPFFMSTMSCVGMSACAVTTASGGGIFEVETMRYPADPNYMYKHSKLSYGQWYGGGYSSETQAFEVVEAGGGKTQPPASGTVAFNVSNMVFVNGTRFELWGANDDQNR
jgi:hypothetical protein